MIKIINISILSMLAIGRSKYAPGTVASFVTALIFILFFNFKFNIIYIIICVCLIFVYSVYTIDSYLGYFDEIDSREIVIDEFVGQSIPILIAYSFVPKDDIDNFVFYTLLSFATFRLFDITKPYPINKIDKYMKNGFGVMLDDVIAGIYSSVILLLVVLFVGYE